MSDPKARLKELLKWAESRRDEFEQGTPGWLDYATLVHGIEVVLKLLEQR